MSIQKSNVEKYFRVVVDRFVNGYVVCELPNCTTINIKQIDIPFEIKEGDSLLIKISKEENMQIISKLNLPKKTKKVNPKYVRFN